MVVIGDVVYVRYQARAFIEELRSLDKAADPTAISRSLMRTHENRLVSHNCERDFCQYQYLFTNGVISTLQIVPKASIRMYLTTHAGSLSLIYVEYTSAVSKADSPIVSIQEDFCRKTDNRCNNFDINPHGRDLGQTWNGIVEFGQLAREEQKRAAWGLNLNCLTTIHGCQDISQLLPTIWKGTSPGKVSSRVRSDSDSIAESSQPLPE